MSASPSITDRVADRLRSIFTGNAAAPASPTTVTAAALLADVTAHTEILDRIVEDPDRIGAQSIADAHATLLVVDDERTHFQFTPSARWHPIGMIRLADGGEGTPLRADHGGVLTAREAAEFIEYRCHYLLGDYRSAGRPRVLVVAGGYGERKATLFVRVDGVWRNSRDLAAERAAAAAAAVEARRPSPEIAEVLEQERARDARTASAKDAADKLRALAADPAAMISVLRVLDLLDGVTLRHVVTDEDLRALDGRDLFISTAAFVAIAPINRDELVAHVRRIVTGPGVVDVHVGGPADLHLDGYHDGRRIVLTTKTERAPLSFGR